VVAEAREAQEEQLLLGVIVPLVVEEAAVPRLVQEVHRHRV
jgi:hypothetical protein